MKRRLKQIILIPFLLIWYAQRLIPRNRRLWVFGDRLGRKCSDNTEALFTYINQNHPNKIKAVWLTRSVTVLEELRKDGKLAYHTNSLKGILYSLRAGLVICSVSRKDVNPYFVNGAVLVNTWHGAPMKKIGLATAKAEELAKKRISRVLYPYFDDDSFDYLINTSPFFSHALKASFRIKSENLLLTGYPRNDVFFSCHNNKHLGEIDIKFNNPRKIMYLPTWRRDSSSNNPFATNGFNSAQWADFLEATNSVLFFKGHPGIKLQSSSEFNSQRIVEIEENPMLQINEVMQETDILITDYSGAYFDFILKRDNKVILFPYDIEIYSTADAGLEVDYFKDIEGIKCYSWGEILDCLQTEANINITQGTVEKFNYYNDGNSSKRVYEALSAILKIS